MLKSLPGVSKRTILTAINEAILGNYIRDSWRIIKIIPIPKPNKDLNIIENFRPISLISVLLKCVNLMIKSEVSAHLDRVGIFPARSFAYRRGSSTATCINEFLHRVALLKANDFKVLVLSLDISKCV